MLVLFFLGTFVAIGCTTIVVIKLEDIYSTLAAIRDQIYFIEERKNES